MTEVKANWRTTTCKVNTSMEPNKRKQAHTLTNEQMHTHKSLMLRNASHEKQMQTTKWEPAITTARATATVKRDWQQRLLERQSPQLRFSVRTLLAPFPDKMFCAVDGLNAALLKMSLKRRVQSRIDRFFVKQQVPAAKKMLPFHSDRGAHCATHILNVRE